MGESHALEFNMCQKIILENQCQSVCDKGAKMGVIKDIGIKMLLTLFNQSNYI